MSSLEGSSIPLPIATHLTGPAQTPLSPELNTSNQPGHATRINKFLYTDGDVHEHPPEGKTAPIIVFPGDDATNIVVKRYLLDMLTKTGWGIAVASGREIRATINSYVGNGWALRKRYAENRLDDICPQYYTVVEEGFRNQLKVSPAVRSNISKCIMREMERYFAMEDKAQHDRQYGSDEEETLTNGSLEGPRVRQSPVPVEDQAQRFRQRPRGRSTLPGQWMSDSLRERTEPLSRVTNGVSTQAGVKELNPYATEDDGATSPAISSRIEVHDNTADATRVNARSTTVSPDDNKVAEDAIASKSTSKAIKPPQTQQPMSADLEHWIHALPSTTAVHRMITGPPSSMSVYKDMPEVPDAVSPALPVSGPSEGGDVSTVNNIPMGSKTRKIAEQGVEEARVRTEEATAERQQVALTKGKGKARGLLEKVWGKIRMRKQGKPGGR
ncbi:hypothetical protein SLS60_008459 [Paraconiothyrium brasiliense]|uniref:Uncharacterized protein n=1 Tax=Paraconiothyrium brasiliense TaxID=300254 RepID=A0ABR3R0M3_9PLEO